MSIATGHVHNWRHMPAHRTPKGAVYGPYEMCPCGKGVVLIAQPPTDHPDANPLPLTDADEALLAALDAELSKEAMQS